MMSSKKPNRLAQLIDHQAFAGSALPHSLRDNMQRYTQATAEVKVLLVDCLPEEILNTCWVVGLTADCLTLSVGSMTAANHIRYLQNAYLQVLTEQSSTFKQLTQIRVVIANIKNNTPLSSEQSSIPNPARAATNQALSQKTKRTISQAAGHVITDENLKKALLRLLNE